MGSGAEALETLGHYLGWADRPKTREHKELVVLIDVLSDEINIGYDSFVDEVVSEVNGRTITSIHDLVEAFESNDGDYHRVVLGDAIADPSEIILSRKLLDVRNLQILQRYQVPKDRSDDLIDGNEQARRQ